MRILKGLKDGVLKWICGHGKALINHWGALEYQSKETKVFLRSWWSN